MILLKIAFRNIFRHKRRSILTATMIAGGYALCAFSIGMAEGTYDYFISMFTKSNTGDIQIHREGYLDRPTLYKTISNYSEIDSKIKKYNQVRSTAPRVYAPAMVFNSKKTVAVNLVGVDPEIESQTTRIPFKIGEGNFPKSDSDYEIVLGNGIASLLDAEVGEEVSVISQGVDGSIANENFKIVGIIEKGHNELGKMDCFLNIKTAQQFLSLGTSIHEIVIVLDSYKQARSLSSQIAKDFTGEGLSVNPWQEIRKDFYHAMLVDKEGLYLTNLILLIIVGVGVLNTVLMSILDRTREFGIFRVLGTEPTFLFNMILLETFLLTVISIGFGLLLGIAGNLYLMKVGIPLSTPVDYGGMLYERLTGALTIKTFLMPAIGAIVVTLLICIFPAVRAAKIQPIKAIDSN
jgi:putative ABC transport system permease protein